jgi:hypothetical protein
MSTTDKSRSRWLDWQPSRNFQKSSESELTKTTKADSGVFVSSHQEQIQKIEHFSEASIEHAVALLNRTGARIVIYAAGDEATGIWSDLDGPEVRAAIRMLGRGDLPVVYLDSPGCPNHYKVRRVPGELIPLPILAAMEAAASEPWHVRDELMGKPRKRQ